MMFSTEAIGQGLLELSSDVLDRMEFDDNTRRTTARTVVRTVKRKRRSSACFLAVAGLIATTATTTIQSTIARQASSYSAFATWPTHQQQQQKSASKIGERQSMMLHVLSPIDPVTKMRKDNDDNMDRDGQVPLFQLEDSYDEDGSSSLYQVSKDDATRNDNDDDESSTSLFSDITDDNDDDDDDDNDQSFLDLDENGYFRDEDEILTEREDRMYMDEKGIRRKIEKCILVGVEDLSAQRKARRDESLYIDPLSGETLAQPPCFTLEESMVEMRELVRTSGLDLCGEITQRLQEVNPKTYIGTGKVKECMELMEQKDCCTIVFDAELTPGQQKALENAFNKKVLQNDFLVQEGEIKVIDRTALILDIFAQHAKTREGKLQVDLALHEYRKPRLTRMWTHLERQSGAGGVGLRGPGESQLEIDKRLVRDRIITLKQKIDDVQKQRAMHRRGRQKSGLPILSLVGYTNAGKSSLLNFLTRAGVFADSMLFATVDPTTRKVKLPGYKTHPEVLLTDTVGFVQKLPTQLVAAFRATLEEVQEADVLIHVIDVSNPTWEKQERAVRSVLADIDAGEKTVVRVLNKIDLLDPEDAEYLKYEAACSDKTVAVSALHGDGMQDFVAVVEEALSGLLVPIEMEIPYGKGEELNAIHEQGNVEMIDYRPSGTYVMGRVPKALASRLEQYSLKKQSKDQEENTSKRNRLDEDDIDWVALGRGRHKQSNE